MQSEAEAVEALRQTFLSESNQTQELLDDLGIIADSLTAVAGTLADVQTAAEAIFEALASSYGVLYFGVAVLVAYMVVRFIFACVREFIRP